MTEPLDIDAEPGCGTEQIDAIVYEAAIAPIFTRIYQDMPVAQPRFPWSRASGKPWDYGDEWECPPSP